MRTIMKLFLGIVACAGVLVTLAVTAVLVMRVPPASEHSIKSIEATFVRSGLVIGADPEDDLFIFVEEYATPFRINRAAEAGFLAEQFVADVRPGDRIELLAFKRYLPRDPQKEILLGSVPTWTVLKDDVAYMPHRLLLNEN